MRVLFIATLIAALPAASFAAARPATNATPAPVLVELFTSEGCSSCPPADLLLQKLPGKVSRTGAPIIVLSEHVTYWDHDGWKDRFSDVAITDRQTAFARSFHLPSVYTPQMVVNGRTQFVGNDPSSLQNAIDRQPSSDARLHIDSVTADAEGLALRISVSGVQPDASVYAVVAQDRASTQVGRGENAGRVMTHVSVARSLSRLGKAGKEPQMTLHLPASALKSSQGEARHLVLFLQESDAGAVLASATAGL